jgi:hypothetical protein
MTGRLIYLSVLVGVSLGTLTGKELLTILWSGKSFSQGSIDLAFKLSLFYPASICGEGTSSIYRKLTVSLG